MTTRRLQILVDIGGNAAAGLDGILKKFGGFGGIAAAGATGLAVLGSGAFATGASLISLGSDAEEMQSKFNVVFSTTAPQVTTALDEFGNAVGRNKFELMGYASTLGDTFKPMGFAEQDAAALSVQMVKLGTDLSSFNNIPMDEALQRLQGTLIGNHENALAFGVIINENTLKAELARNGWDKLSGAQLEQAKVQARVNLLMQGTRDAQGDAERTAGGWANQTRALTAEFMEAATAMGISLLPVVIPFLQAITKIAVDILPKAVEIFKAWATDMQATTGPAMLMIQDALDRISVATGGTTGQLTLGKMALSAFGAVLSTITTAVKLGALAFQAMAWYVETWKKIIDSVMVPVNAVRNAITSMADGAKRAIDGLVKAWDKMAKAAQDAWDAMPDALKPGSPTKFELGLQGIAGAAGNVAATLPGAFAAGGGASLAGAGAGGGPIVVQLTYAPVVSTADELELQRVLTDVVKRINRT